MLRVSRMADYAVVILDYFASRGQEFKVTAEDVEKSVHLNRPTISKVMKLLVKGEILHSMRGRGGGYRLNRRAQDISVADIVYAMDGPLALTNCLYVGPDTEMWKCEAENVCPMKGRWEVVNLKVKDALESVSLEDLIALG